MDKKFKFRSYFETCLDFLPYFGPFGNRLPTFSHGKNVDSTSVCLEIRDGRFPRLILSLHKQFAFNGLNSVFSPYLLSKNSSGTRAQLLVGFGTQ